MKDSYDAQNTETVSLEKTLKELAPTGFKLFKRCQKAWDDPTAMDFYKKLNQNFKDLQIEIEQELITIIYNLESLNTLIQNGKYGECEEVLSQIQNTYDNLLDQVKNKEDKLDLPEKIRLKEDTLTLTEKLEQYTNKLFTIRFEDTKTKVENYVALVSEGKDSKYTPQQVSDYAQQLLERYSQFTEEPLYQEIVDLKKQVDALPVEAEVIKNKKLKKKKKRVKVDSSEE